MKLKVKFTDLPFGFDISQNCYMQALQKNYDVELSEKPDFVFYSVFGTEFLQYRQCVRIFLALEPVLPNFNDCDYAIGPFRLSFENRYFRSPPFINYGEDDFWDKLLDERKVPNDAFERKFCNFVYSNKNGGEGALRRVEFCKKLAEYKPVDCPGAVLNNMQNAIGPRYYNKGISEKSFNNEWMRSKLDFLQKYKFTIAFENCVMSSWITEKFIHPLLAGSVPIYWGPPDVSEYFNSGAFVNCADYGYDFQKIMQRVIEIDQDKEQYMAMLRQRPLLDTYPLDWKDKLAEYLAEIIDRGVVPFEKNPLGFSSVTAQNYQSLCRDGKIGMRKIVQDTTNSVKGWLHYKMQAGKEHL